MSSLAEALTTARRARGLSQCQLADLAGVSQGAISRYESRQRDPDPETVERLAVALGVTVPFIESVDRVRGAWAIDAHLRRRATAPARAWRQLEAQMNMLRHHARYVYEEIDIHMDNVVPTFDTFHAEPDDAARITRMQWRMPIGPVQSLMPWVEAAGCLVIERDFGTERVDGMSQWVDDHPIMFINGAMPTDRKRLTIAHELGHLTLHTRDVGDDVEGEATRFAAEFLMPAAVIRSQLRSLTLGRLHDLKRLWGVSMQALIERAYSLETISRERRTSLYKQLSARSWRKKEPGSDELAPETPRLAQQIGAALAERGLSATEIAHFTGYAEPTPDNPFLMAERGLRTV